MKERSLFNKAVSYLLYGGIDKNEHKQVRKQIETANLKALRYWSVLVSLFWIYCIIMSFYAEDYKRCRTAYIISLGACVFSYLCSMFIVPRFPKTLVLFKYIFRLADDIRCGHHLSFDLR